MSWYPYCPDPWREADEKRRAANVARRRARLDAARAKGTHTKAEWTALADVFQRCVCCGVSYSDLHGGMPSKDHILPLYCEGCDCIGNIQPVCRNCNSSGIAVDLRNIARLGWVHKFLARMEYGWGEP
jgi:hypothetical protein